MRSKFITTVMVGALGLGASVVRATEPTASELMQQVQQLETQIQQLETQQQALSSKDVDATIEKVLKDADQRSQLLQMEGFTAGWTKDKGITIQDAQGNWVIHPWLWFQFRSTTNFRNDGKHDGEDDDVNNGFEVRRMKLGFQGNAFTPDLTYYFLWGTDSSNGNFELEQAWIKYFFNDTWAFRVGSFINPVFHEQVIQAHHALAVDRSMVNGLITPNNEATTDGVSLIYDAKDGPIWAEFGFGDGFDSGQTDFLDPNEGGDSNFNVFGRINYFVKGNRKSYEDYTAMGNKDDLLVIGGGLDFTQYGDINEYLHTVDVGWENTNGLSIYAAYLANYIDDNEADDTFYNWGFLVQGGYMLNEAWEIFARYDYTSFDEDFAPAGENNDFSEVTLGVNWYVGGGHNAKVTIDASWLPDGAPFDNDPIGILASDDDEFMIRGQFQLLL